VSERIADSELAHHFQASSVTSLPRAPLYSALSAGIARDPDLYRLLLHAPEPQRLPVLLFAATHDLLLKDPTHKLAKWYPNLTDQHRSPDDKELMSTFKGFVAGRSAAIAKLLATRSTQTNEVGRCSILLPALGLLSQEMGRLGHIDIGASGGLNLMLDSYEYHYKSENEPASQKIGGPSSVVLQTGTTGAFPVPSAMPEIYSRCGVDRHPIDITDDGEARWLEACVWPDQRDRFHRLREAIAIAKQAPPEVLAGDAVASLQPTIEQVGRAAHPVVTNSWVLNYLTTRERVDYLAELDRIGSTRDLSWIYVEAPALIEGLPTAPDPKDPHRTVLSLARWRNGERSVEHLATCHPHGFWIQWR
jgi:hypothetical protein